jgi:uroporphyrinogen decarboxylase
MVDPTGSEERTDRTAADGIHEMVPLEQMAASARKLRDTYARVPDAPLFQREFGYYCFEQWAEDGVDFSVPFDELFGFDPPGNRSLGQLGWCEAPFQPAFEERIIEDRGDHEVVQDIAGRHVLCFKGRRDGFMPEYLGHPVKDMPTWEKNCKWRMDPSTPERYADLPARMAEARSKAEQGLIITQDLIGGYMYLRSLIGPEGLLYMLYDQPDLIHDCMRTWFELADAVITKHQEHLTIDEVYLAEDICYNRGALISPDMMREFLFPYYQQLIANIRSRQLDQRRHLYVQIDTDGRAGAVIPLYQDIGMDIMSPFEVAAGCDVVELGRQYPDLTMFGGIDKRVLAKGTDAIDRMIDRILPVMRKRGGYIPTCDHGVPAEVSYDDYVHFRKRCREFAE